MIDEWEFETWSEKDLAKLKRKTCQTFSSGVAPSYSSPSGSIDTQAREAADGEAFCHGERNLCPKTPSGPRL